MKYPIGTKVIVDNGLDRQEGEVVWAAEDEDGGIIPNWPSLVTVKIENGQGVWAFYDEEVRKKMS